MTSDVNLTTALQNNLLALQKKESSQMQAKADAEKLAKMGASDYKPTLPVDYYDPQSSTDSVRAASALTNRATDLTKLMDGLGNSIQTIKTADNSLQDVSSLLDEAYGTLQNALQALNNKASDQGAQNSALTSSTKLQDTFSNILSRLNDRVTSSDSGFRGVNLLNGDDLTTFFNNDQSKSLVTQGRDFTPKGLGLDGDVDFSSESGVEDAMATIRTAKNSADSFKAALNYDLSTIQTRQDFTQNLIGTLTEGASKFNVSNQTAEAATLMALQTRQQLEGSSMSLASQSQESILRFF